MKRNFYRRLIGVSVEERKEAVDRKREEKMERRQGQQEGSRGLVRGRELRPVEEEDGAVLGFAEVSGMSSDEEQLRLDSRLGDADGSIDWTTQDTEILPTEEANEDFQEDSRTELREKSQEGIGKEGRDAIMEMLRAMREESTRNTKKLEENMEKSTEKNNAEIKTLGERMERSSEKNKLELEKKIAESSSELKREVNKTNQEVARMRTEFREREEKLLEKIEIQMNQELTGVRNEMEAIKDKVEEVAKTLEKEQEEQGQKLITLEVRTDQMEERIQHNNIRTKGEIAEVQKKVGDLEDQQGKIVEELRSKEVTGRQNIIVECGHTSRHELPQFQGNERNPIEYLKEIQNLIDRKGQTIAGWNIIKSEIKNSMHGGARKWWNEHKDQIHNLDDFEREFRKMYWDEDIIRRNKQDLEVGWYRGTGGELEYFWEKMAVARNLGSFESEEDIVNLLKRHFGTEFNDMCGYQGIKTKEQFEMALKKAYEKDRIKGGNREAMAQIIRENQSQAKPYRKDTAEFPKKEDFQGRREGPPRWKLIGGYHQVNFPDEIRRGYPPPPRYHPNQIPMMPQQPRPYQEQFTRENRGWNPNGRSGDQWQYPQPRKYNGKPQEPQSHPMHKQYDQRGNNSQAYHNNQGKNQNPRNEDRHGKREGRPENAGGGQKQ
jgi:hypothetical protein